MSPPDFQRLFEHAPDLTVVVAPDGPRFTIVAVTDARLRLGTRTRADAVGRSLFEYLAETPADPSAADADGLREALERVMATKRGDDGMAAVRKRAAQADQAGERTWRAAATPLFSNDGHLTAIVHRLVDVTDLVEASRELEVLSYSVSHDLRAPLRAIDGFSRALAESCGASIEREGQEYLERISSAAQRLSRLMDALLDLSRIGRAPVNPTAVNLSALAEAALFRLSHAHPLRQVAVDVAPGLTVVGDRALLQVAIDHLIDNAWKFTARVPLARVEVGRQRDGRRAFFVRDNGAGFDPLHAGRLFGPFQRLHSPREFDGIGAGLATVQRVIAKHGGRVWADAEVAGGATFFFTLPD